MTTETARVDRTRLVGIITLSLVAVLVLMTASALVAVLLFGNSLDALKTTSRRGECRSAIVNADEDTFRHRIGDALGASVAGDRATVTRILRKIQREEQTQHKIERICPAPLDPTAVPAGARDQTTTTRTTSPEG